MSGKLEIDALRALLSIEAHGGVTRAAQNLGLSQSAVSHKIRRLEQALGCDLLARRAGGPLLTEAGARLCGYARRMMDLHDEALANLGTKPLSGSLRLGMTEDTTISGISRILGRFTRLYPKVEVRTRTGQSLNVQRWLQSGALDVAVMQVFDRDVQARDVALFNDTLHWVKAPDYRLDPAGVVPFLSFDPNCFYRQWGLEEGRSQGHRFETVLECPSAAGVQAAVRSGLGVALLNGMHLGPGIDVIEGVFPAPPPITFVARCNPAAPSGPANALVAEIAKELVSGRALKMAG